MRYEYNTNLTDGKKKKVRKTGSHPIWRGIGFLIMLIIPVVSFGLSEIVLNYLKGNIRGFIVPGILRTAPIQIAPEWVVRDLWAVILIAFLMIFILLTFFVLINTMIFGLTKSNKKDIFESNKKEFRKSNKNRPSR